MKCKCCCLNSPFYITTKYIPKCAIVSYNNLCIRVKVKLQNRKYFTTRYNTDRISVYNDYLQRQHPIPSRISLNLNSRNMFIASLINGNTDVIRQLNLFKIQLESLKEITFYTDGSVQHPPGKYPIMGFAWTTDIPTVNPSLCFKGTTTNFTSSTKAENFAILTALIVCPELASVTICSDSQSSLHTLNNFSTRSSRKKLKQNNFLIWHTIDYIIEHLKLTVTTIKVKAHSGNKSNDLADALAKEACLHPCNITINHRQKNIPNNVLIWNESTVVDQDARKTMRKIQNFQQFSQFLKHSNLLHIRSRILRKSINLKWTSLWLKHSPFDTPTSAQFSLYQSYKYKYHLNQLPTTDILHKHYPKLIKHHLCFICNRSMDSNHHLWRCPHVIDYLYNAARGLAKQIIQFLGDIYPHKIRSIISYINHLELFDPASYRSNRHLRNNHPIFNFYQIVLLTFSQNLKSV